MSQEVRWNEQPITAGVNFNRNRRRQCDPIPPGFHVFQPELVPSTFRFRCIGAFGLRSGLLIGFIFFPLNVHEQRTPSLIYFSCLLLGLRASFNGEQIFCFSFHQNQNSPLIGQRRITPPRFKSAHQWGANFDFDEMKFKSTDQSGANFDSWWKKNRKSVLR